MRPAEPIEALIDKLAKALGLGEDFDWRDEADETEDPPDGPALDASG